MTTYVATLEIELEAASLDEAHTFAREYAERLFDRPEVDAMSANVEEGTLNDPSDA